MRTALRFFITIILFVMSTSCTQPNALSGMGQTNTDQALYIQAQQDMDNSDWSDAINILTNQLSSSYRAQSSVVQALSGAYAGQCGLNFPDLVNSMKQANSSTVLFSYIMQAFQGVTAQTTYCDQAITTMQTLGTVLTRTTDQNLFLAILGVTRIGTTLNNEFHLTTADGGTDASFSVCNNYVGGSATDGYTAAEIAAGAPAPPAQPDYFLTDAQVQTIAAGVGLIFENLTALSSAFATTAGPLMTSINTAKTECESIVGVGNCSVTSPSAVSAQLIYAYRILLDTSIMGIGSCDPTVTTITSPSFCCPALLPVP